MHFIFKRLNEKKSILLLKSVGVRKKYFLHQKQCPTCMTDIESYITPYDKNKHNKQPHYKTTVARHYAKGSGCSDVDGE